MQIEEISCGVLWLMLLKKFSSKSVKLKFVICYGSSRREAVLEWNSASCSSVRGEEVGGISTVSNPQGEQDHPSQYHIHQ